MRSCIIIGRTRRNRGDLRGFFCVLHFSAFQMQERALAIGSELVCVQPEVPPATREQFAMRSLLGDPALLDDDDQICPTNRRKSVCNDEGNAPTTIAAVQNFVDAFLDETLSRRVDRTRRFVHHENFRVT